jgi:hypothetical protein
MRTTPQHIPAVMSPSATPLAADQPPGKPTTRAAKPSITPAMTSSEPITATVTQVRS